MRIEVAALGLFAAVTSTIALLLWRGNRRLLCRLAHLAAKCDQAESDKASVMRTLAIRSGEEDKRLCSLEHDIKSSLGVILGFSLILREIAENDPRTPPLPLKNINAIHQAATRILNTIDAAVKNRNAHEGEPMIVDGKT